MESMQILGKVSELAIAAGDAIMAVYNSGELGVEYKEDDSPLTLADQHSHDVLETGLAELDLGPILSEEGADIAWSERKTWSQYWLIDPLDGTKEFVKRNGEFTVNVALIREGKPVLGVVYAPAIGVLYYGALGLGAFKKEAGREGISIQPRPVPLDGEEWIIAGSRSHQSEDFKEFVQNFQKCDLVSMGSSLKLCLVAEGKADLYPRLGLTSEWDTAAAQAVVEAAGGSVLNWETKEPLQYNTKESLLNPFFIVCSEPSSTWLKA